MQAKHRKADLKILIPKEHGAWATLFVPFFVGLGVAGGWDVKAVLLLGAILFLYLARYPLVLWARAHFKKLPTGGMFTLLISSGHGLFLAGLLILKYQLWLLVPLGLAALLLLFVHLWLVRHRMERTILGEFLGVVALTSAAPAAFYTATGSMSQVAFLLWFLCALFFGSSVFYVKMQVARYSSTNPRKSESSQLASALVLYQTVALGMVIFLSYLGYLSPFTGAAFIPLAAWMLARVVRGQKRLEIKRLGFTLLGHSIAFGIALIFIFLL